MNDSVLDQLSVGVFRVVLDKIYANPNSGISAQMATALTEKFPQGLPDGVLARVLNRVLVEEYAAALAEHLRPVIARGLARGED